MTIDRTRLQELRRFRDPEAGFEEAFLQPALGGVRTLAMLTRPLGEERSIGWVFCHSFGIEQVHLGRVEVTVARDLAAAGFHALRYHGRGYGDSQGSIREITLRSHLEDAAEAVALMREQGVRRVGLAGVRFGGLVAALTADRTGADYLCLWEPVLDGRRYMDSLLRGGSLAAIAGHKQVRPTGKDVRAHLQEHGWADLDGFPLSRACFEEVFEVRVADAMSRYDGSTYLLAVNAMGEPGREQRALAERLRALGGTCTVEALKDRGGFSRFRYTEGDATVEDRAIIKIDTLHELTAQVSGATLAWCRSLPPA